ncbi:MAG TPA: hypothetical protein VF138_12085 [Caulobacteraceae bacterium]
MARSQDPREPLEEALKKASEAGRDDDPGEIAADDAGGTRLAEHLDDEGEAQAHPS